MRVLLLTPPMTQLNTPYPATAYLTGFLRSRGVDAVQADPALVLVLRLLSVAGLNRIQARLAQVPGTAPGAATIPSKSKAVRHFLHHFSQYSMVIEPVIAFLQGKDPSLALRIVSREFLPEGARFAAVAQAEGLADEGQSDGLQWAFGSLGIQDRAKYLASLMVDDLMDVVREGIDPRFELSRYGEKLAASAPSFSPLQAALEGVPTLVDEMLDEITAELYARFQPKLVGLTAPFPGNVYGALRIARWFKKHAPEVAVSLGGGYPNTELRELKEPRVFDYVDYITLDDGERPLLCLLEHLRGTRAREGLFRTFIRDEAGAVQFVSAKGEHDIPHRDTGTPTYDGLPIDQYLSIFEMLNPMHRIWSDGRWNKLTLAHGCYWKKCNFCDVNLDYIGRYDAASADLIVDRIAAIVKETGTRGFHFVDEAAPPAVLRAMSQRLLERGIAITWWGNVRFEKTFTPELAQLMARAGCVAVSGGLEVASDRLLEKMNKGVTVEQVARVTRALTEAGIMVHAYLMYGFPTQTVNETIDALERVRQLFAAGCLQSAYWHRFSATAHSPIGRDPAAFGIELSPVPPVTFARNDLAFTDATGVDHDYLGDGLKRALYNFMHGIGIEEDVRSWFAEPPKGVRLGKPQVARDLVERALAAGASRRESEALGAVAGQATTRPSRK